MNKMSWTKRITISAGLVLTSLVAVPAVAGADYTTGTPPQVNGNVVSPPSTDPVHTSTTAQVNGSSSLPFTGADIGELAAVGAGAVVVGVVLTRRRRSAA
jgi:hypothetical protein